MTEIVLDDLTLKAKKKMLQRIMSGLDERIKGFADDPDYEEQNVDFVLAGLLDLLDQGDCEDFWGTEGWRENFGI